MPKAVPLRQAQKQFTHDRLVEAAVTEFCDRGYRTTTVDDIAARAGTTRATFYNHFTTKSDIIVELMESDSAFRPRWDELRAFPRKPNRELIRAWLADTTSRWAKHRDLISVIRQAVTIESELNAAQGERFQKTLTRFVEAIRHLGWSSDTEVRVEAMLLFAQLERIFSYWDFEDAGEAIVLDLLTENWWQAFQRAAKSAAKNASQEPAPS
ncbi:MAG TPA: TetR/AcrR family transcriptional regulator [Solirubrobacteraceae bacterium]|jgi:AcrR family transcriptional regulator|nr:TetR/AcrR family transcriptional regulator [Solirubrobacteraceae bacterium]